MISKTPVSKKPQVAVIDVSTTAPRYSKSRRPSAFKKVATTLLVPLSVSLLFLSGFTLGMVFICGSKDLSPPQVATITLLLPCEDCAVEFTEHQSPVLSEEGPLMPVSYGTVVKKGGHHNSTSNATCYYQSVVFQKWIKVQREEERFQCVILNQLSNGRLNHLANGRINVLRNYVFHCPANAQPSDKQYMYKDDVNLMVVKKTFIKNNPE